MYPIKQSTSLTVPFFAHDANGDAVTGLADGDFTKRISKGSGSFGAMTATMPPPDDASAVERWMARRAEAEAMEERSTW